MKNMRVNLTLIPGNLIEVIYIYKYVHAHVIFYLCLGQKQQWVYDSCSAIETENVLYL